MKKNLILILLSIISCYVNAQQFFYSSGRKVILTEDTLSICVKTSDPPNNVIDELKQKMGFKLNSITTSKNSLITIKLKQGVRYMTTIQQLKSFSKIQYAWVLLKDGKNNIIPTGEILLLPKNGIELNKIIGSYKDKVHIKKIDKYGVVTLDLVDTSLLFEIANKIYEIGDVEWCLPNFWIPIEKMTNDPLYSNQYYLKNTGAGGGTAGIDIYAENAWLMTKGSSNIKIGVIDDGVEDHEDLQGRVLSGYTPKSPAIGNGRPVNNTGIGHGQACAGIIAATQDNSVGIAGIAPNCNIVPVNIFYGGETTSDIANGINWAWDNGNCDILSNSWGYNTSNQTQSGFDNIIQAINNARSLGRNGKGSLVVFASGNGSTSVSFPGNVNGVITVGAIDKNGTLWSYSNTGTSMDLVAPSGDVNLMGDITTIDRENSLGYEVGNYTNRFGGTSAACPQISGVAALILSVNPDLTESQVKSILQSTAVDMGSTGFDNSFGYGRVNACEAVKSAVAQISGPQNVCFNAQAVYQVPAIAGATYSWNIPANFSVIGVSNSNQVTLQEIQNESTTQYDKVTITCDVTVPNLGTLNISKIIDIGQMRPPIIADNEPACSNGSRQFYLGPEYPYNGQYQWIVTGATIFSGQGTKYLRIQFPNNGYGEYSVDVKYTSACGESYNDPGDPQIYDYYGYCGYQYVYYPNPSTNELTVSYEPDELVKNAQAVAETVRSFSISILDGKGKIWSSSPSSKGNKVIVDTSLMPDGNYFLHIKDGKQTIKKQIIVKH